ncbi:hypothetical protein OVA24_00820 [Luteolibacter sp. SL250]|uniref:hypothetical protein n=1 Tax=Luteolibacter sp. SL250 TaxID=2995170 RepID=UPI00226EAF9E|nr:hypothetical protein [Luteolibacter sp. SL250]WAC19919.1 hypothetical protein OVA24_00820 [Luteolibacter sp. SL250]
METAGAAETVAKADLVQYYRDLFGIVVSRLPHEDAVRMKAALDARGFPVEIVDDAELPPLPADFQVQRVDADGEWLRFTDSMGRVTSRALADLVFLSAGHVSKLRPKSENILNPNNGWKRNDPETRMERTYREEMEKEFRIEFFFWTEPQRLKMSLAAAKAIFVKGRSIQLHKQEDLAAGIAELRALLPPERANTGIRQPDTAYPSLRAYEEEIRWHFHRIGKGG